MTATTGPDHATTAMRDGVIGRDADGNATVYFEREFSQAPATVWHAITDPAAARGWLGSLELEPRVGGHIAFRLDGTDPVDGYVTEGVITAYVEQQLLECTTAVEDSGDASARHRIRYELVPAGTGTLMKFTQTFAVGERARNSIVCGWHNKLEQIADTASGKPTDWSTWNRDRIIELYWHYRNKPRN